MKIHIEHKLTVLIAAFAPVANAWGDEEHAWDLLNGWLGPVANRWLLQRSLPAKVLEVAHKDRALSGRFRALPRDMRQEVCDLALDRLLRPVPGLGVGSMWFLDSDAYEDKAEGSEFEWACWRLIRAAIDAAMKASKTARKKEVRRAEMPEDVGSWDGARPEAGDIVDGQRLTHDEQMELVEKYGAEIDGILATGMAMSEAQKIIAAFVMESDGAPSASKIARATGFGRRDVGRTLKELARNMALKGSLKGSIAERDATASMYASGRARTRAARNHDGDHLEGMDRKLHAWTSFEAQEERLTREAIAAERLEQRLAQKAIPDENAACAPGAESEVDERRARERASMKPNAGVAPGVLRDPNIAAPSGPSAGYAEDTHPADCPAVPKSAV